MKKLSKINLGQLHKNDMADREMNQLRGGNNCGCNCRFDDLTEQSVPKSTIYEFSWAEGYYDGDSTVCSWEGSNCVYGGSKVPQ